MLLVCVTLHSGCRCRAIGWELFWKEADEEKPLPQTVVGKGEDGALVDPDLPFASENLCILFGVIILTVSGVIKVSKWGCFPLTHHLGGDFDHMRPVLSGAGGTALL